MFPEFRRCAAEKGDITADGEIQGSKPTGRADNVATAQPRAGAFTLRGRQLLRHPQSVTGLLGHAG